MSVLPKLLIMSIAVAATIAVATPADGRRFTATRPNDAEAPESVPATAARVEPVAAAKPSFIPGIDARNAVIAGVAAGAATAVARNARAEAQFDSASSSVASGPGASLVSLEATEARLKRMDANAGRQKPNDANPTMLYDKKIEKPGAEKADAPVVKSASEIRREKKEADELAAAARIEGEKKIKLAREMSCRVEPVMSDAAIATCQKVFR